MQGDKFARVSPQPVFEAPTVKALLWILGQHHGHPQADPGGTARDQHYFLPGTRHDNPAGSQSICHLTAKLRDNKRIRKAGVVTWVTWTTRLQTILVHSVLSFSFIYLILGHNYRGFLKPHAKYCSFFSGNLSLKEKKTGKIDVYSVDIGRHPVASIKM